MTDAECQIGDRGQRTDGRRRVTDRGQAMGARRRVGRRDGRQTAGYRQGAGNGWRTVHRYADDRSRNAERTGCSCVSAQVGSHTLPERAQKRCEHTQPRGAGSPTPLPTEGTRLLGEAAVSGSGQGKHKISLSILQGWKVRKGSRHRGLKGHRHQPDGSSVIYPATARAGTELKRVDYNPQDKLNAHESILLHGIG